MLSLSACSDKDEPKDTDISEFTSIDNPNIQSIIAGHDSSGYKTIFIPTTYKFTSRDWEYLMMGKILTDLRQKSFQIDQDSIIFLFEYGSLQGDNISEYCIDADFPFGEFRDLVLFDTIANYLLNGSQPGDFAAYDSALSNNIESKYSTFLSLVYQLSRDLELSLEEERILTDLIDWSNSRSDREIPDHFIWLRDVVPYKVSDELELDLRLD